jgi:hypothetical protein
MNKKIAAVIGILVVLYLFATLAFRSANPSSWFAEGEIVTSTNQVPTSTNPRTYENSKYGFAFDYPGTYPELAPFLPEQAAERKPALVDLQSVGPNFEGTMIVTVVRIADYSYTTTGGETLTYDPSKKQMKVSARGEVRYEDPVRTILSTPVFKIGDGDAGCSFTGYLFPGKEGTLVQLGFGKCEPETMPPVDEIMSTLRML